MHSNRYAVASHKLLRRARDEKERIEGEEEAEGGRERGERDEEEIIIFLIIHNRRQF